MSQYDTKQKKVEESMCITPHPTADKPTIDIYAPRFYGALMFEESFAKVIECQDKIYYDAPPYDLVTDKRTPEITRFVQERFYPMPDNCMTPMLWNWRCDYLWEAFSSGKELSNPNRAVFWSTVREWLPKSRCERFVEEERRVEEVKTLKGREKHLWRWKAFTYELRGVGFNGRPKNPPV